jgi:hypothetical protein
MSSLGIQSILIYRTEHSNPSGVLWLSLAVEAGSNMRSILLSLTLLISAVLPAIADDWEPEGGVRLRRNASVADTQFQRDFTEAPRNSAQPPSGAEFTLDVSQFSSRRPSTDMPSGPVLPITSGVAEQGRTFFKKLMGRDLQILGSRDIILLIDKSGSMGDKDCPPPTEGLRFPMRNGEPIPSVSRWDWCEQELISLSRNAAGGLQKGMRVVLFAGDQTVYDHVNISQVSQIFHNNWPQGSTNAAAALQSQLEQYFSARARGERVRPLVIAIITDGLPNSSGALKQAIVDMTRAVRAPGEIAITFLQIGNDKKGIRLVHEIDDKLVQQGALYDLVDSKDFGELQSVGLGRALVDAINKASQPH